MVVSQSRASTLSPPSSSGSGGRDYKVDRSPPSAEQLARNAQEREAAQQAVNEAVAQRDGATDELMKRLWRAADIAYQLLPDGSLSAFPNNWAYGDAANTAFFTGESEGGRPVLVADGDAPRTDASTATPQPATVTPELTNTCDDGALPQQPAVEAVTPVAVPIDDPVDRYPPWQDPLKDVLSPSAKSSTTSPPMY